MNYLIIKQVGFHFYFFVIIIYLMSCYLFIYVFHTLDPCNQVSVISNNVDVIFLVNLRNMIVIASAMFLRHDATLSLTICALSDINIAEL